MMNDAEIKAIATAWNQLKFEGKPEDDENFWAYEKLYDLCVETSEDAWKIIRALLALNPDFLKNREQLARIAAGPIEDLLVYHGDILVEEFERLAKEDDLFRTVLGGVWKRSMKDEVWTRIQAVAGPSW